MAAQAEILHEGYLTKMKTGLKRSQKRFFVLSQDKLIYFESNKKAEEIGWMPMSSLSKFELADSVIRFSSTRSHLGDKEKHNHEYKLKAESKDDAKQETRGVVLPSMELEDEASSPIPSPESTAAVVTFSAPTKAKESEPLESIKEEAPRPQEEVPIAQEEVPKPVPQHFVRGRKITTIDDMRASSRKIFKKYASIEDPTIMHADQLRRCCSDHGYWMNDEELCHALSVLDVHRKGCVDCDTFLGWWSKDDRFEHLRASPEQLERLQHMSQYFTYFDFDKNGTLDLEELALLHKDLVRNGYHIKDIKTCTRELDQNGDGVISFNEFVIWMEKTEHDHEEAACHNDEDEHGNHKHDHYVGMQPKCASRLIFDKFDTDSSGSISATELQNLCYQHGYCMSDEELAAALCKIDLDSSGTIDFDEFLKWWKSEDRFESLRVSEPELLALERLSEYFSRFSPDRKLSEIDSSHFQAMHKDMVANGYQLPEAEDSLRILDTDSSGTVSYNEFVRWMMNIGAISLKPHRR